MFRNQKNIVWQLLLLSFFFGRCCCCSSLLLLKRKKIMDGALGVVINETRATIFSFRRKESKCRTTISSLVLRVNFKIEACALRFRCYCFSFNFATFFAQLLPLIIISRPFIASFAWNFGLCIWEKKKTKATSNWTTCRRPRVTHFICLLLSFHRICFVFAFIDGKLRASLCWD